MKNIYKQSQKVVASLTDTNAKLGLVGSLTIVQDNMCEFFEKIKCDGLNMVPVCNCFFVVTKSKIRFTDNILNWLDDFNVKTELASKTRIRLCLNTGIENMHGVVAECAQEMCAIDATSRSLRVINTTLLPEDIEETKRSEIEFEKIMTEFDEFDLVKVLKSDISNLDFYKHVNNVEYVKLLISTLSLEFFESVKINEFEIHYLNECRCCEELKVYKRELEGYIDFVIKNDSKEFVKARIKYSKK